MIRGRVLSKTKKTKTMTPVDWVVVVGLATVGLVGLSAMV